MVGWFRGRKPGNHWTGSWFLFNKANPSPPILCVVRTIVVRESTSSIGIVDNMFDTSQEDVRLFCDFFLYGKKGRSKVKKWGQISLLQRILVGFQKGGDTLYSPPFHDLQPLATSPDPLWIHLPRFHPCSIPGFTSCEPQEPRWKMFRCYPSINWLEKSLPWF